MLKHCIRVCFGSQKTDLTSTGGATSRLTFIEAFVVCKLAGEPIAGFHFGGGFGLPQVASQED